MAEQVVKVLDEKLEFAKEDAAEILVSAGVKESSMRTFPCTSFDAMNSSIPLDHLWAKTGGSLPSTAQWSFNTPFPHVVIDRQWRVSYTVAVVVTGAAAVGTIEPNSILCWRQLPLVNNMRSIGLTLNGTEFSCNPEIYSAAILRYNNNENFRNEHWVGAGSHPDVGRLYDSTADGMGVLAMSPFAAKYTSGYNLEGSRLEQTIPVVTTSGFATTYTYVIDCPIFCPPLLLEKGHGFSNIATIDLRLDLNCITNLFSVLVGTGVFPTLNTTTITMGYTSQPNLYLSLTTPSFTIPKQITIPSLSIQTDVTAMQVKASVIATADIQSELLRFAHIPSHFYVFIRKKLSNKAINKSDADFLPIVKMSIMYDNTPSMYIGATQKQLYDISAKNGLISSFRQFSNYEGSVLCFAYGSDIPCKEGVYVGSAVYNTLQVTIHVTAKNPVAADTDYELVLCVVKDSRVSIGINSAIQQIGMSASENSVAITQPVSADAIKSDFEAKGSGFGRRLHQYKNSGRSHFNKSLGAVNSIGEGVVAGRMVGGQIVGGGSGGSRYVNRF
jgi:hypothetical protein